MNTRRKWFLAAISAWWVLLLICFAWEMWLAPLRPGGSWLALKVLPLCIPLGGLMNGRLYTFRYCSMLILFYVAEGVVRLADASLLSQLCAGIELAAALIFYVSCLMWIRLRPQSEG